MNTYFHRQEINRFADGVRNALKLTKAPYDPKEAIRRLGGFFQYDDLKNIDAYIKKKDNSF